MIALLVAVAGEQAAAHRTPAYSHEPWTGEVKDNWMAALDGDRLLSELSIPGTHDSGAYLSGGDAVETQSMNLVSQLYAGIRAWDIRLVKEGDDQLTVYHGIERQGQDFADDVLWTAYEFLKAHPTETILMRIRHEGGPLDGFESAVLSDLDWYRAEGVVFEGPYTFPPPKLDDVRGKIVLFPDWHEANLWFRWGRDAQIQDEFSLVANDLLGTKWTNRADGLLDILEQFENANDGDPNKWYINFLSAATGSFPYFVASGHINHGTDSDNLLTQWTPSGCGGAFSAFCIDEFPRVGCCFVAFEGMNVLTWNLLNSGRIDKRAGIVFADFPGAGLIHAIIRVNGFGAPPELKLFSVSPTDSETALVHGSTVPAANRIMWSFTVAAGAGPGFWSYSLWRRVDSGGMCFRGACWELADTRATHCFPNCHGALPGGLGQGDYLLDLLYLDGLARGGMVGLTHDTVGLRFSVGPEPPTADAGGPYSAAEGSPANLDGTASHDGRGAAVVNYEWDLDNDGEFDDFSGPRPSVRRGDDGVALVSLKVTDDRGLSATDSVQVRFDPAPPVLTTRSVGSPAVEGSSVAVSGVITDPGWLDPLAATIDWRDGSWHNLDGTVENVEPDASLAFDASHSYAQSGLYQPEVCFKDEDGPQQCTTVDVPVLNVAPAVDVAGEERRSIDEGESISVAVEFHDPGVLDTHHATVHWGTGESDDEVLDVSETEPGAGTASAGHLYGDNGLFAVRVDVTDSDEDTGSDTIDVDVANVAPTAEIDRAATVELNRASVLLSRAGQPVSLSGHIADPGSDDVRTSWAFGDGSSATRMHLANPPFLDGFPSPSPGPRAFRDTQVHTFRTGCVYEATLSATDDDGGSSTDSAKVIVTGNAAAARPVGSWKQQLRGVDGDAANRTGCRLAVAGALSRVFSEVRDASTAQAASAVLSQPSRGNARALLDRQLLTTWLNVASGAIEPQGQVDTNGDGTPDASFADVIAVAEDARLDGATTRAMLERQKDILERLNGDAG